MLLILTKKKIAEVVVRAFGRNRNAARGPDRSLVRGRYPVDERRTDPGLRDAHEVAVVLAAVAVVSAETYKHISAIKA